MARNRPNPLDDPPAASSSEEHHEEEEEDDNEEEVEEVEEDDDDNGSGSESSDDEEEEEEEEEEKKEVEKEEEKKIVPPPQQQPKPLAKNPSSDTDDETESDTDTTRSPGVSGFTIRKHVATTPASVKPKKPEPVSLKRPAESDKKDSRAKKAKAENGEQAPKKSISQVWSEDDVIVVLEAMLAFIDEKGVDPLSDGAAFHEYVKGKLSVETSFAKLMEKMRRMKRKYLASAGKGPDGEDPVYSRPFDVKTFQLSKKIWGGGGGVVVQSKRSSVKKKPTPKDNGNGVVAHAKDKTATAVVVDVSKKGDGDKEGSFSELYPFLNLSLKNSSGSAGLVSKDGAEAMEGSLRYLEKGKLEELEGEWKKQILAEADVAMGRFVILQKQVGLVSDWHSRRG